MKKLVNTVEDISRKGLIKEYGDIFFNLDRIKEEKGDIIPTTLSLDIALNGGILAGTIATIAGVSGSGKTTLALTIAANAQALGYTIYYVDAENRLQDDLLSTIPNLDTSNDKFIIIRSDRGKILTAEDNLNIILSLAKSQPKILVIVDSVASLCPAVTYENKLGESKQLTRGPQLMYDALRQMAPIFHVNKSVLIGITHMQANPSPYGGPNEVGGNALKYFASTRITCLSSFEIPKTDEKKTGRQSEFKVFKTALGPGTGSGTFYIKYNHGYDKALDLVNLGEEIGIIEKAGAWYKLYDEKYQGIENVKLALLSSPELMAKLEKEIRELAFKK